MSSGKESKTLCDPKDATQESTIKVEPNMNDFYLDKDIIEAIDSLHDLFADILETKNSLELQEEQNAWKCGKHKKAKEEGKIPSAPPAPSINAMEESSMKIFNPESTNSNVVLNNQPKSVKENTKTLNLSDNGLTNLQSPQGSIHNKIIDSPQLVKEDKGWYSPQSSPETSRSMSKNRRFEVGRRSKSKNQNISPRKHMDKRWRSRLNSQNISPRRRRFSRSRSKNRNTSPSRKSFARNRHYKENRRSRSYNRNISARRRSPSHSRSNSRYISPSRRSHFNKRWRSRSYSRSISLRREVGPRNEDRNERSRPRSANQNNFPSLRKLLRSRSKSRNISPPYGHLRRQARCNSRSISSSRGVSRSRHGNDRCRSRSNNSPRRSRSKNRNNSPRDKRVSRNRHFKNHWLSKSRSISPNRGSRSRKSNERWRSRSKSQNISSIWDKSWRSKSPNISPSSISTVKDDHSKQHGISKSRNISSSRRKPWTSRSKSRTRVVSRGRSISPQKGSRLRSRRSRSPQCPYRSYTEQVLREESKRSLVHQSDIHISEQSSNLFIPHERALYNSSSPRQKVKARQFVDDTLSHQSYYLPFLKDGNLINTRLTSRPTMLESHFNINTNPMANLEYQGINHFYKFGYQTLEPHDLRHRLEIRRYYNYEMSQSEMFNYEYLTY